MAPTREAAFMTAPIDGAFYIDFGPTKPEVKLSSLESQALTAWIDTGEDDDIMSFGAVCRLSGISKRVVRRVVRAMARKGITKYCRCGWNDDGQMGAGYGLTEAGRAALRAQGEGV